MKKQFEIEKENAVIITAYYNDWDGDVRGWQEAYFKLLAWKNTWGLVYRLDIMAKSDHSPFVELIIDPDCRVGIIEMMEDLGYKNMKVDDIVVGTIDGYVDDDDIWDIFVR